MIRELAAISPQYEASNRAILKSLSLCADWIEERHKRVTAAYTVQDETVILADATGAPFSVTLPPSDETGINRHVHIKRLNAGGNSVTVAAAGSDTIDGAATNVLSAQYNSIHVLADGAGAWHILF